MHLLYLTEGVPNRDPRDGDGSSMIPYEVIRALPADIRIDLLTFDGPVPVPAEIAERCDRVLQLPVRSVRSAILQSVLRSQQIGELTRLTGRAHRTARHAAGTADVTLVHGPQVGPLVRGLPGPVVWQTVDPWSRRARMDADLATGPRRTFRELKARQALRADDRIPERVRLLTVGGADATAWERQLGRPVRAVPNGVAEIARPATRPAGPPTVCFVGSLDYEPNVDSVHRLVRDVLPILHRARPDLEVVVAGRRPVPAVLALAGGGVRVLADVPEVADIWAAADVALFPDRHGLGIRNSVGEAVAAGLPVVASPAAAREQPDHPLLEVAVDDEALAAAVLQRLDRPGGTVTAPSVRTWDRVAGEYREELDAALRAS